MQDVYLLDKNLELVHVFDSYVSLIWSTRYVELGDCELYIPATTEMLQIVKMGYYLKRPDDDMVCVIRKIELTTSEDGNYITITGKDVRTFADQRVICSGSVPSQNAEGVILTLLTQSLGIGADTFFPGRRLRKENGGPLMNTINYTGIEGTCPATFAHENLGAKIREILKGLGWGMKFFLRTENDQRQILPLVYKGEDRSRSVVFSSEYENLHSSDYLLDGQGAENTALVFEQSEEGSTVYRFAGDAPGVDRYEKAVKASGLADTITWADLIALFPDGTIEGTGEGYIYTVNPARILAIPGSEREFTGSEWTLQVIDGQPFYVSSGAVTLGTLETNDPQSDTKVTMAQILKQLLLRQRGMEQISGRGLQQTFSAVIDPETTFVFRQDFDLGDIVTVRNEYGITLPARITEIVEVNDSNGYSCQPKLETALGADLLTVRVIGGIWRVTYSTAGQIVGHIISKIGLEVPRKENIQIQGANIVYYEISEYGTKATVIIEDISFGATMVAMCCTYIYAGAELGVRTGAVLTGDTAGTKQAGAELEITPRLYYEGQSDDAANATLPGRYGVGADPNADSIDAKGAIPAGGVGIGAALPADSISARAGLLTGGVEDGFTARGWLATCVHDELTEATAQGFAAEGSLADPAHGELPGGQAFGAYLSPGILTYRHAIAAGGVEEGLAADGTAVDAETYVPLDSVFFFRASGADPYISIRFGMKLGTIVTVEWGDGTSGEYGGGSIVGASATHQYSGVASQDVLPVRVSSSSWMVGSDSAPYNDPRFVKTETARAYLETFKIGSGCTRICKYAFGYVVQQVGTSELKSGDVGPVYEIGQNAFSYCKGLTDFVISNSVMTIESGAFAGCANLAKLVIGDSVASIESVAFSSCSKLKEVYLLSVVPPVLVSTSLSGIPSSCNFYVPASAVESYKTAQYWSARAAHILPIE